MQRRWLELCVCVCVRVHVSYMYMPFFAHAKTTLCKVSVFFHVLQYACLVYGTGVVTYM